MRCRYDIQGLRAIGALMIMIYHIWIHKVSGGVDVFFVISGFLLTGVWITHFKDQKFPYAAIQYLMRVIDRISPSAYLILVLTFIASFFFIPYPLIPEYLSEFLASALHLENLQLSRKSVDYLERDTPQSPVQQFWALSIQIQFYLMISFLFSIPTLLKINKEKTPYVALALFIFTLSFTFSLFFTTASPEQSYFNTFSRFWEFLAGSLVYLLKDNIKIDKKTSNILGIFGIIFIASTGVVISKEASFPGHVALLPVSGAIMVIISGLQGNSLSYRILSLRALSAIGPYAFTIYLWHWPILVFFQHQQQTASLGIIDGLSVIIISIIFSYITHKTIEGRSQKSASKPLKSSLLRNSAIIVPVVFILSATYFSFKTYEKDLRTEWINRAFLEKVIQSEQDSYSLLPPYGSTFGIQPEILAHKLNLIFSKSVLPEVYYTGCHQDGVSPELKTCSFGRSESDKHIVLIGGSHAAQWIPALKEIAFELDLKMISITKSACFFGAVEGSNQSCSDWNESALDYIIRTQPLLVITNHTRTHESSIETIPSATSNQISIILDQNIPVLGIRDNPRIDFDPTVCVARESEYNSSACSFDRRQVYGNHDGNLSDLAITVFDIADYLCEEQRCFSHLGGHPIYRDSHHLTVPFTFNLYGELKGAIREALSKQ